MNLHDYITQLMQHGAKRVTFALDDQNEPIIAFEQMLPTSNGASKFMHEVHGQSFDEAHGHALRVAAHCGQLQSKVLKLNRH